MTHVEVFSVDLPLGAAVGYASGTAEGGEQLAIVGDRRQMRRLGEALLQAGAPIEVDVEDWRIVDAADVPW